MFKFIKKIFFIIILSCLVFGALYFKNDLFKSFSFVKNILQQTKNIFQDEGSENVQDEKNSYKLKTLQDKNKNVNPQKFEGTEEAIITLINKERFDLGLKPLDKSKRLMASALAKAKDMKRGRYFEHVSRQKIQPWFFVEQAGYQYEKFGENIAQDYLSANSVHKAFMDSQGHRRNILEGEFKDVGVAIIPMETGDGFKYIIVEHFGRILKNIKVEKREKYSDKSKHYCGIQKDKKEELKEMIKNQKEVIKEFEKEINKNAVKEENERLEALYEIKNKINGYLDDCKILKKKYEEIED
jgi:uncharacterized protein YkwD